MKSMRTMFTIEPKTEHHPLFQLIPSSLTGMTDRWNHGLW